jgi:hypothetical protein
LEKKPPATGDQADMAMLWRRRVGMRVLWEERVMALYLRLCLSMSVVKETGKAYMELILGRFEQVVLLTQGDYEVDFLGFVVADAEGFEFAGEVVLVDCVEGGE